MVVAVAVAEVTEVALLWHFMGHPVEDLVDPLHLIFLVPETITIIVTVVEETTVALVVEENGIEDYKLFLIML
jgi:hypothetical protein